MTDPIPVTLLTGFLGAGKTTLLNHLLHDPSAGRIAVVVNEFGDAGLDHDLIEESAEDVVLMSGGCLCCSIRGDLSRTLTSLLARRAHGDLAFDRVVIETTGLADPGPILHTLLVDRLLAPNYALDGIVTAVDMVLGAATLDQHPEAQAQVAMADRIVLTKSDLADAGTVGTLEARLNRLNTGAARITAEKGALPAGALFGLGALRNPMTPEHALDWLAQPDPDPLAGLSGLTRPKPPADLPAPAHHAGGDRIATASLTLPEPIPAEVFDFWLDTLIALRGENILRLKGIVHIEGASHPFVFHGVQHIFEPPVPLTHNAKSDRTSRVVIIARDMPDSDLQDSLSLLQMTPDDLPRAQGMTVHTLEQPL
jgi:G3E family GTPase